VVRNEVAFEPTPHFSLPSFNIRRVKFDSIYLSMYNIDSKKDSFD
jgi:hypothetical protein